MRDPDRLSGDLARPLPVADHVWLQRRHSILPVGVCRRDIAKPGRKSPRPQPVGVGTRQDHNRLGRRSSCIRAIRGCRPVDSEGSCAPATQHNRWGVSPTTHKRWGLGQRGGEAVRAARAMQDRGSGRARGAVVAPVVVPLVGWCSWLSPLSLVSLVVGRSVACARAGAACPSLGRSPPGTTPGCAVGCCAGIGGCCRPCGRSRLVSAGPWSAPSVPATVARPGSVRRVRPSRERSSAPPPLAASALSPGSHWGTWDTGQRRPVSVRRRDGRWVRFMVPILGRGRVCTKCAAELVDWRATREPAVTVVKEER